MARLLKRRVRGSKFLVLLGISLSKCLVCNANHSILIS